MKQPVKIILTGFIASALLLSCGYFSGSDLKLRILFDETIASWRKRRLRPL